MVEHVQQAGGERERRRPRHAVRFEGKCKAEPDEDDPDVLHGMVRKQALEIVLHQRIKHAHHRRDATEREYDHAPPPGRRADEIEYDAHETVDGDLRHDPAHQRRNMTGGGRMRERQPDVQRHEACLGAGADQREDQNGGRERGRGLGSTDVIKGIATVWSCQQPEGKQQGNGPEACHDQVEVACPHVVDDAVMRHDQRPGRQRHELPRHQKCERIIGEHDDVHAGEESWIER